MQADWLSNAYLVGDEEGGKAVVIDSGGPSEPLLEAAERHGLDVELLLLTHHHGDHVAENHVWKERHGVEILAHPLEAEQLDDVDRTIEPGETLEVGGLTIESAPHAGPHGGMLNFVVNGTDVFTGDTLFKGSVGGVRAPGSTSFEDLQALDHGRADEAAARDACASGPHRPDDDRRRVGVERLRPAVARARRGGRRALHAWRARTRRSCSGRPTTTAATRPGCAGPTAATTSCPEAASR